MQLHWWLQAALVSICRCLLSASNPAKSPFPVVKREGLLPSHRLQLTLILVSGLVLPFCSQRLLLLTMSPATISWEDEVLITLHHQWCWTCLHSHLLQPHASDLLLQLQYHIVWPTAAAAKTQDYENFFLFPVHPVFSSLSLSPTRAWTRDPRCLFS